MDEKKAEPGEIILPPVQAVQPSAPVSPPQVDSPLPQAAALDAPDPVLLEVRVEELERRLRARSIEFETELKAKERLRERVRELTQRIDELQETASAMHREAVSSTSLARQLDETLKVASEARLQLTAALEGERSLRAAAEEKAAGAAAEIERAKAEAKALVEAKSADSHKRDEELASVRRQILQLRQKTSGNEAHIDSLRLELEQVRIARDEAMAEAKSVQEKLSAAERKIGVDEEKTRRAAESAELIRREGVDALERARETQIRQEIETERTRHEAEVLRAKTEKLKVELRARADREIAEMRHALDEERARLYADIEAERQARGRTAPFPAPVTAASPAPVSAPAPIETPAPIIEAKSEPPAAAPVASPPPSRSAPKGPGFQWIEEVKLLVYVTIGAFFVALLVGAAVLFKG